MSIQNLPALLANNPYPGRGILLGRSACGKHAAVAYFIMGRSSNSRNRVFTPKDGGIITEAADPGKMQDPSLIIYAPVRLLGGHTIVTNGDQTDTIYEAMAAGGSFEQALRSRSFEPDAPNYTPRISGLLWQQSGAPQYRMSILKSAGGNPAGAQRFFYEYENPLPGQGHFIHTYIGDGDPLPSFAGEPVCVALGDYASAETLANEIWQALDAENRVSLFVRLISEDGSADTHIVNRFSKL